MLRPAVLQGRVTAFHFELDRIGSFCRTELGCVGQVRSRATLSKASRKGLVMESSAQNSSVDTDSLIGAWEWFARPLSIAVFFVQAPLLIANLAPSWAMTAMKVCMMNSGTYLRVIGQSLGFNCLQCHVPRTCSTLPVPPRLNSRTACNPFHGQEAEANHQEVLLTLGLGRRCIVGIA